MFKFKRLMRRIVTPPLMLVAALVLFFEEWLWQGLKSAMAQLGRLPLLRRVELWITQLSPGPALALFLLPSLLILPVKLAAVWFMLHGRALTGLMVIVAAKVAGMALFSRIFVLCRPALLTVPRFRRFHDWLLNWSARLHAFMDSIPAWQAAKAWVSQTRQALHALKPGFLTRRWHTLRERLRRRH